jgi:hypothetical protein
LKVMYTTSQVPFPSTLTDFNIDPALVLHCSNQE